MPHHPHAHVVFPYIVKEMVGEAVKVAAAKSARIKMKSLRISSDFKKAGFKLSKEVFSQSI